MISEGLKEFYIERTLEQESRRPWYLKLWDNFLWRFYHKGYCPECDKYTYWNTTLLRLEDDTPNAPPIGSTIECVECGIRITSSPFAEWDALIGDIEVTPEIEDKYLHPMR